MASLTANPNLRRLVKDVSNIIKSPLDDQGIYYSHSEDNLLEGHALIFGPEDTIYANGCYFFKFDYPTDYPFTPPKVTYLTNNGTTRFNPNLYRNGKVCISLLNTWKGEQWTSCQTISTILLTLTTLFHNKPLLNEPGITEKHQHFTQYNNIIECDNEKDKIMRQLTRHFEQGFTPMWKITDVPKSNRQAMYQQLSFIEFTPTHWSGNFKLSQNKSPEVRARIKQSLELANKRSIAKLF